MFNWHIHNFVCLLLYGPDTTLQDVCTSACLTSLRPKNPFGPNTESLRVVWAMIEQNKQLERLWA